MDKLSLQTHPPLKSFVKKLSFNFLIGLIIISLSLGLGMCGYHYIEGLPWVDAFLDASMILAGMGPVNPLASEAGKIFAGFYALFSGIIFLVVIAVIFAPVVHRFLHKFHIKD